MKQGMPKRLRHRVWFHPAPIRVWLVTITFLTCVLATHSPLLHQWLHGESASSCVDACSDEDRKVAGEDSSPPASDEEEEHHCGLSVLAAGYHLLWTGLEDWNHASPGVEKLLETGSFAQVATPWLFPASRAPPAGQ